MSTTAGPLLDALEERRKRALREILSAKDELEADHVIPSAAADALRRVIVDHVNDLARLAGHLVTSVAGQLEAQAGVNQLYLERIVEILGDDVRLAPDEVPAPPLLHAAD